MLQCKLRSKIDEDLNVETVKECIIELAKNCYEYISIPNTKLLIILKIMIIIIQINTKC